jgi:diadenylate cyclase
MSEESDAVILVVSEETGAISIAFDAKLYYDLSPIEAQRKLKELLDRGVWAGEADQKTAKEEAVEDRKDVLVEQ